MCDLNNISGLAFAGEALNVEERAGLEVGMVKRRNEEGLDGIEFWGKVKGTDNDYLVCVGYSNSVDYPNKKFYFCTSKDLTLKAVPELTEEFETKASGRTARLKGDPSLVDEKDEVEEEEDEDAPKKVVFSESHRLAYAIKQIDADTAVVPRGAYMVTATHTVARNKGFEGLDAAGAASLDGYFHYREPVELRRKTALERSGMVASTEFLDPLSGDAPKGVWSVRVDAARGSANVRSLKWPGYFFFHDLGTGRFGGAYFGYGLPNTDIGFMV